jgi:hypothetical protein
MISVVSYGLVCFSVIYLLSQFKVSIKYGLDTLVSFVIGCLVVYTLTYQSIHILLHQNDDNICIEERL